MRRGFSSSLRTHRANRMTKPVKPLEGRLFGKYDELIRMLLGFMLTGVVGTYLSHQYTTQQADLAAASRVFSEHSKLIGDRHFSMTQLTRSLREAQSRTNAQTSPDLQARLSNYRTVIQEWNSQRGFNREMIELYFGRPLWNVERDIHYKFFAWGQSLETEYKNPGSVDFTCIDRKVNQLLELTHGFRASLAKAVQHGAVGSARDKRDIELHEEGKVWCTVSR